MENGFSGQLRKELVRAERVLKLIIADQKTACFETFLRTMFPLILNMMLNINLYRDYRRKFVFCYNLAQRVFPAIVGQCIAVHCP